jgi:hypothetical protein
MSLLTVVQNIARGAGFEPPQDAVTNTDTVVSQTLLFVIRAGEEIARRADWKRMGAHTVCTDGQEFPLPANFHRLVQGAAVRLVGSIEPVRGSLSNDQFRAVMSAGMSTGTTSRLFFRLTSQDKISFTRVLTDIEFVTVNCITDQWVRDGTTAQSTITADSNTFVFPERLIELNALARWKRQKGLAYKDEQDEFEAEIANEYAADQGIRVEAGASV